MSNAVSEQGWGTKPLIEVATLQRGHDLPVQDRADGAFPIFAANGPVGFHDVAKCDGPGVVTGRSGTIGKVHFVEGAYWPLNTALYVTNFHGNHPKWVYYMLQSFRLERFAQGAGVPTLNRNLVHGEPIRVPPLPEQRRIAAILDKADALRAKRREVLAQLDTLKQSIFIEIFGDAKTNPMQWPIYKFGTVCNNEDSRREPVKAADRARRTGIYPYYGASGVIDWLDDYLFDGERLLISEDGANLLARSSPIAFIASGKYWVNNHAHVISSNGRANLRYLEFYLEAIDLTPYITGSAQPKLNQSNLDRLPVPLPPLSIQDEFARRLSAVEKVAALHQRAATAGDDLFASLQHRAFGGQL